jgi:hypothetical protein
MLRRCLWLICLLLWPIAANAAPGTCGGSAGQTFTVKPTSGLCNTGVASDVTGGTAGPWSWYCRGSLLADPAQVCSAKAPGYLFVDWTDPSGTVVGATPTLVVADAATAATYTAHFKLETNLISLHGYADMLDFKGGASHSVVLKSDHTVVAWGGTGAQSNLPAGTQAIAIDAGVYHTLVIKPDGTVAGFGVWSHPVAVPDDPVKADIPVAIPGGVRATAVAGGYAHSLALLPTGEVVGWGDNYWGQITIPPEAKSGVIAIAAGHHHSLALKDDGTVIGWGRWGEGQVPQGPTDLNPTASRIPAQVAGKKIVAISAKAYHSVALTADGKVICWGANELGQGNVPATLSGVTAIAAGGHHTVALKKDGTVVAWGDNKYSQSTVPSYVTGVSAIAAGTYHTYALRGASPQGLALVAWGQNQSQQCEVPARAYTPVTHGVASCMPAFPPYGSDSTCTIGTLDAGYGLAAFVVNGQTMPVTTDTVVIKAVKDFTDVTVGFSQGAQVSTFDVPALYNSTTVPINSFTATGQGAVTGYAITMSETKPASWSSTPPTTFNVGSAGPHTLYAWAKDAAGNVSTAVTRKVEVDNAAPTVTAFTADSPVNHYYTSITAVTASDGPTGSGVTGYLVKDTQMAPDLTTMGWAARPPGTYTFSESGTKTLYAWARDAAGNISQPKTVTVVVDTTPPVITSFTLKTPSVSKDATITSLTATDSSPIVGYLLSEKPDKPAIDDPRWTMKPSYTFAADGDQILYAFAKDNAGNISAPASALVTMDATPPVVRSFVVPPVQKSLTVPITMTAEDTNSAVTGYAVTTSGTAPPAAASWKPSPPTSFTATAPGQITLYAWAKDAVGNVSAPVSATVNIDTTPPTVTFTASPAANSLTVPINLSAMDTGGVAGFMVKEANTPPKADDTGWLPTAPATFTLSAGGTKTIYAWAKDQMGNVSTVKSVTVSIDTTPPTITGFAVKSPAGAKVPITAFTATDNVAVGAYLITESANVPGADAPWSKSKPASYTATTSGDKTLYAWVKDTAGNVSASKTVTTSVDAEAPAINFSAPELTNTLTIPVTFGATDNKGVTGYQITLTKAQPAVWKTAAPDSFTVPSPGVKTLYAWATDAVGNVSFKTATVNIDKTPPVVTFTSSPSNTLTVPIALSANDTGGVAGYIVKESNVAPKADDPAWRGTAPATFTVTAASTKTIYAWAIDRIGNISLAKPASVIIDTTPPVVTAFAAKTPAGKKVQITSFIGTDNVGVGSYLITETPEAPLPNAAWSTAKPTTYDASTAGPLTLYGWVKDKAGNVALTPKSATVTVVDAVPPVVTDFAVPQSVTTMTIPITAFTANDTNLTGYLITTTANPPPSASALGWRAMPPASFTVTTGGQKTLYAWAKDAAGNISAPMTAQVSVDLKPPVIISFVLPATSASLTVPITTLNATDDVGVTGYFLQETALPAPAATAAGWSDTKPDSYTFTTPGIKALFAWVKDAAGRVSAVKAARTTITAP